jgi:hypothetical protein
MNRMSHSKTMSTKRAENKTSYPRNGGPRPNMAKGHTNYAAQRRQGGPFGK